MKTLFLVVAFLTLPPLVSAASFTWSSTAATGSMSTGSNWVGGSAPSASSDIVIFGTSTTTAVVNDFSSLTVSGMTFNDGASYTVTGNAISLSASGSTIMGSSAVTTLNTPLALLGNATFDAATGGRLVLNGVISGAFSVTTNPSSDRQGTVVFAAANTYTGTTSATGLLQLQGAGTLGNPANAFRFTSNMGALDLNGTSQTIGELDGDLTSASANTRIYNSANGTVSTLTLSSGVFNGTIYDNNYGTTTTGKTALVKTGSGTFIFARGSSFSGGTTVSGGNLLIGPSSLANATGTLTVNGGTLATYFPSSTVGGDVALLSGEISINDPSAGAVEFSYITIALNPSSSGTLTLAAGKNFSMSGGTLNLRLGTAFDQVASAGSGSLFLTGGTIDFTTGAGFSYANSYHIFNGFAPTSFSSLTLSGYDTENYLANISEQGWLTFTSAIPEPSTYAALVGVGVLAFAAWPRRKALSVVNALRPCPA